VHLCYICLRKGLPAEDEQRAALAAGGASAEELTDVWRDDCRRKPRPGEPAQPERDHILGAARPGDVVLVARLGVLATTPDEALRFVARLGAQGTALKDASTGRTYTVRPEASQDVADALALAADIAADERRMVMERARSHIKERPGKAAEMSEAENERARVYWHDQTLTNEQAVAKIGRPERMIYRALGKRHRPAFGKMTSKARKKPDV
jgi:DNA invertase Pin-like site-specific DNA recombinase